ncbi:hypothetical protein AADS61_004307 [Escherichia coli]|uniref:hypothetical protein n=1 Tax=Citrobacter TaxID=544 RepID=UPI000CDD82CA|nr:MULTISPECIES: hypothetical protein [Citrobacter]ELK6843034.1 hypothetical protein [Citrobacter braakii]MBJ9573345.1 hypothetical protein [Citrobacter braakii]POT29245.1 hypothetical protein C3423_24550 [Citrobacter braakii]POT34104.1 hypothetical protein C3431_24370 [Citrobacter braakii]POT38929.1 hypothetical protein C3425_24385 [Citrobacter braakii]
MAKLNDCQFIKITIDGKDIAGSSVETTYKGWMEGYAPAGLMTYSGADGTYFEPGNVAIQATKETSALYEHYLKRGYKKITVTIVHRGSDQFDKDYEIQRAVYNGCKFNSLSFDMREKLFMNLSFSFEGMVEVTFNVPNAQETGLDKIGPIKYDIPEKTLK